MPRSSQSPGKQPDHNWQSLGVLADRLFREQSLQVSWQGDESGLAMSFWGLWNPSIMEFLGTSTVTSSAPWLRIPNWSFSWCLYTKLVNYENLSTAFLLKDKHLHLVCPSLWVGCQVVSYLGMHAGLYLKYFIYLTCFMSNNGWQTLIAIPTCYFSSEGYDRLKSNLYSCLGTWFKKKTQVKCNIPIYL